MVLQTSVGSWPLRLGQSELAPTAAAGAPSAACRGLFTTHDVAAGELVLAETPLLSWLAAEFTARAGGSRRACSHCSRLSPWAGGTCGACECAGWCSPACCAAAQAAHGPRRCAALRAGKAASLSPEEMESLDYVTSALSLPYDAVCARVLAGAPASTVVAPLWNMCQATSDPYMCSCLWISARSTAMPYHAVRRPLYVLALVLDCQM
jgi:hypothetical protein